MVVQSILRLLKPPSITREMALKELACDPKKGTPTGSRRAAVRGTGYSNPDGSDRQQVLAGLKEGRRVRLVWDAGGKRNRQVVYVVRSGLGRQAAMQDCFGTLDPALAEEVVGGALKGEMMTGARIARITGGTARQPKRGSVLELTFYRLENKGERSG